MLNKLKCVVLIDDNEADNFLHRIAIDDANCAETVVAFEMAEEALEAIRSGQVLPDLIFLDINMPGMDGWAFLREFEKIEANRSWSTVTIVMLTTSLNPEDRHKAGRSETLAHFCNKPLSADLCVTLVREHFPDRFAD